MAEKETMVATIPAAITEGQLNEEVADIGFKAESLIILNDEDYAAAGQLGRVLKQKQAEVTGFFKPMKDSAHKAHKIVCDREKAMLKPLKDAEETLKQAMGNYAAEQERKRKELEENTRKAAEEEREKKLLEATALEAAGDAEGAAMAMEDAVVMDEATTYTVVAATVPKTAGVTASNGWEITEIDPKLVPIEYDGAELRPVDEAAVMRLIKASKGTVQIPGVVYKEVQKISFRR